MNIFITSQSSSVSAINLCDQHRFKMISESTQLLCNAYWLCNAEKAENLIFSGHPLYKLGYALHPCTKWVAKNLTNFYWLVQHLQTLLQLYKDQGGKKYQRESTLLNLFLSNPPELPTSHLDSPFLAFGTDISKELNAVYKAVQSYYGVWDEELGVFTTPSWDIGLQAYQTYINIKEFKPLNKRNPITGEVTETIRQFPTFKKKGSPPEWYSHVNYENFRNLPSENS